MNEADTRANLVDPKLVAAGWGQLEGSHIRREVSITQGRIITGSKRSKPVISDYALEYRGRKLAAVEAKKESLSYSEGVRQAKDYVSTATMLAMERRSCSVAVRSALDTPKGGVNR